MKFKTAASLIAFALAAPAFAAPAGPGGFQLRPSPTPTATPQVQGPVDTEGARPVAPRPIPQNTPTPAPTAAPTPAATEPTTTAPTSTPVVQPLPRASRTTAPQPQRRVTTDPARTPSPTASGATPTPAETPVGTAEVAPTTSLPTLPNQPASVEAQSTGGETTGTGYTLWIAGALGLVILLGGAIIFGRRRKTEASGPPEIEPPSKWVSSSSDAANLPPLSSAPKEKPEAANVKPETIEAPLVAAVAAQSDTKPALQIKAQALTLSRSLMNATFSYRVELMNLNNRPISEISVKADLVTAHGKAPIGEQVASEDTELPESAFVASIKGRETHEVKGSFSLPVSAIRPITQRGATLYVPLLRLRFDAEGMDPIICTFVVGIKPAERDAKLQPFRLDEMAQTYRNIGLRLID